MQQKQIQKNESKHKMIPLEAFVGRNEYCMSCF